MVIKFISVLNSILGFMATNELFFKNGLLSRRPFTRLFLLAEVSVSAHLTFSETISYKSKPRTKPKWPNNITSNNDDDDYKRNRPVSVHHRDGSAHVGIQCCVPYVLPFSSSDNENTITEGTSTGPIAHQKAQMHNKSCFRFWYHPCFHWISVWVHSGGERRTLVSIVPNFIVQNGRTKSLPQTIRRRKKQSR